MPRGGDIPIRSSLLARRPSGLPVCLANSSRFTAAVARVLPLRALSAVRGIRATLTRNTPPERYSPALNCKRRSGLCAWAVSSRLILRQRRMRPHCFASFGYSRERTRCMYRERSLNANHRLNSRSNAASSRVWASGQCRSSRAAPHSARRAPMSARRSAPPGRPRNRSTCVPARARC